MIRGFQNQITEKIFGFWGHVDITDINMTRTQEQAPISISEELRDEILKTTWEESGNIARVKYAQSYINAPGILTAKDQFEGLNLKGVGADFNWKAMSRFIIDGDSLYTKEDKSRRQILVSKSTSKRMKLALGDPLIIHYIYNGDQFKRRYNVGGIYNTGLAEYDQKIALVDIRDIQQILGWSSNQVGGLEVFVNDIDNIDKISEVLYFDVLPPNIFLQTIREKFPNIFEWLSLQSVNETVILALMVIVCIINMMTVLLILILERSKMIGTLKSIGATNWMVRKVFLYQALYILIRGAFWGTAVGLAICYIQMKFGIITLDEVNYYLSVAPVEINLWHVLLINLLTVFTTIVFMIIPTYLITKISPVKVLRFD